MCHYFARGSGCDAKYCDEYVCLSVCLFVREDIYRTTRAIFTNFLRMLPMSVAWSSSSMLTISRIAYLWEGVTGVHRAGEVCYLRLPCCHCHNGVITLRSKQIARQS